MLFRLFDISVQPPYKYYAKEILPHYAKEILQHYAKEMLAHSQKLCSDINLCCNNM